MTRLADLSLRRLARVHSIAPGTDCCDQLLELGLVPGTQVQVVRKAPLGDPIQVDVAGAQLALRGSVASLVLVEPV